MRSLLQILFPPLCLSCKEKCETNFLCKACWELCAVPDPLFRCRHCFEELDDREDLCLQCRKKRKRSFPFAYVFDSESPAHLLDLEMTDALAGFALLQWIQLDWPMPDAIIPMPDSNGIAFSFAKLLDKPFIQALSPAHEYKEERLEEDQILLLFTMKSSLTELEKAGFSLSESLPKKIYILSLFAKTANGVGSH